MSEKKINGRKRIYYTMLYFQLYLNPNDDAVIEYIEKYYSSGYLPPESIHIAVRNNRLEIVKHLIDKNKDLLNDQDSEHRATPLMVAAQYGCVDIARYLLSQDNIMIDAVTTTNRPALYFAAFYGQQEIVDILIEANAKQDFMSSDNKRCFIHTAVMGNLLTVVKTLIEHDPTLINKRDGNGDTPLIQAVQNKQEELTRYLSSCKGVDLNATPYRTNTNALDIAVYDNLPEIVKILVNAPTFQREYIKFSTLFYATKNLEILIILIDQFPELLNQENDQKRSVLTVAAENNCIESVKYLLKKDGIITGPSTSYAMISIKSKEIVSLLIKHCSPKTLAAMGDLPFNYAAHESEVDIMKFLFQQQGITLPNLNKALHFAAEKKENEEIINLLLQNGSWLSLDKEVFIQKEFSMQTQTKLQLINYIYTLQKTMNHSKDHSHSWIPFFSSNNSDLIHKHYMDAALAAACDLQKLFVCNEKPDENAIVDFLIKHSDQLHSNDKLRCFYEILCQSEKIAYQTANSK